MESEYYYFIFNGLYDDLTKKDIELPIIRILRKDKFSVKFKCDDIKKAEGPFNSLSELKKKSFIFSTVIKQKNRDRISNRYNIKELQGFLPIRGDIKVELTFLNSLNHTIVGKISKQKVKGLHFYNPDEIKITERIAEDIRTGVYSARIEKFDKNTGLWIKKEEITTFFPDNWSIHRLFYECLFAYENKKQDSGNLYSSNTISNVPMKFVINEEGKIITFYPTIS